MWSERLLQVVHTIRGMVDDTGLARLYELAKYYEPHKLEGVKSYDSQFVCVLKTLYLIIAGHLKVVDNLSIPFGNCVRQEVSSARGKVEEISERIETITNFYLLSEHQSSKTQELAISNLQTYDLLLLSRVSDLQRTTSRLTMAVEDGDMEGAHEHVKRVESVASDLPRIFGIRTPENFCSLELLKGRLR